MIKVGNERELMFNRQLRYNRQKHYNIDDYEYTNFNFGISEMKVYKNFNFSIFVDDYCNADCKFCVAQLRYHHVKQLYNKLHIKDDLEYLNRLDKILEFIRPLNPSISITGGEPTLSPRLNEVLKLVDSYDFRKRTITTNGSGLLTKVNSPTTILDNLIKYHWDYLNISRASSDDEKNRAIMRYHVDKSYCDNLMLKQIIHNIKGTSLKHRMSCLLLSESVNNVSTMKDFIDFYESCNINNYIFRELMDFSKDSVNKEKMRYCMDNKIHLNNIWEEFDNYPEFIPYLNILGYYYYVEIYKYHNHTIASESADLNQQYIEKGENPNMIYEMVFHTNGNLCGGWIDNDEVLDEYTIKNY